MRFTRQSVETLAIPAGKPYAIFWDETLKGFGVRVNPTGKVWVVQFRTPTGSKRITLGRVGTVGLDDARKAAREALAKAQLGGDPAAEKQEARARASVTFKVTAGQYLDRYAKPNLRPNSLDAVTRFLTVHWSPFDALPLHKITRAIVAARLGEIAADKGPVAANRARAALSAFFAWAMGEGLADANPVVGTNKAKDEAPRERVLTDAELSLIWNACRDDDYGRIVRLLMLTAQRRDEVGGMAWGEVELSPGKPALASWTIPGERAKNGRTHLVPLSGPALAILEAAPRVEGRAFVFGEGKGGFSGWSKAKAALDARIAAALAEVNPKAKAPPVMTAWTLHDLRRTAATRMADLGALPHVVEAVLNHVSGHRAGVAGIYNRAAYAHEKRQALDLWAAHVVALVSGEASNVVALSARGRA